MVRQISTMTLAEADAIVAHVIESAARDGALVAVAVTGSAGDLIAFAAMDDVVSAAASGAIDKARTSASLKQATADLQALAAANPALGLGLAVRPSTIIFGGGVPVVDAEGQVVGAVGVSGCPTAEADHTFADNAARTLTS